jgi:ABC-2 type transport system permease protein
MNKYFRYVVCAMQETLAYRTSYFLNVISSFVFYFALFFVWKAIFQGSGGQPLQISLPELKAYIMIALIMNTLVTFNSEFRISRQIRSGNIAMDLLHPLDYLRMHLSITFGSSVMEGGIVSALAVLFALFIRDIARPPALVYWPLFIISIGFSFLIKFLIVYIFALFSFWTTSVMGVVWFRRALTDFFSGAVIPVIFFPDWLKGISDLMPFQGIIHIPAFIFLGKFPIPDALRMLGVQALWIALLWAAAQVVWKFALRKVTILGG